MLAGMFAAAISEPRVNLGADRTVTDEQVDPATALASFSIESDGDYAENGADAGDWVLPKGAAGASYEARATVISGTLTSGTSGSWLALSSTRTWTRDRSGVGERVCVIDVEVRHASTGVVFDIVRITLHAIVT